MYPYDCTVMVNIFTDDISCLILVHVAICIPFLLLNSSLYVLECIDLHVHVQ